MQEAASVPAAKGDQPCVAGVPVTDEHPRGWGADLGRVRRGDVRCKPLQAIG
jgi:hypothetical protein